MMPAISIVIPLYNCERFVARCFESLLVQSFSDFEIVVVDDGSTDRSGAIADEFATRDPRIRVIHQANAGVSAARNRAMQETFGDFYVFIDPDDFVVPGYLEALHGAAARWNADIAHIGYIKQPEAESDAAWKALPPVDHDEIETAIASAEVVDGAREVMKRNLDKYDVVVWGKIFAARIVNGVLFSEGKIYEDSPYTFDTYSKAERSAYLNLTGYYYLYNPEGLSHSAFRRTKLQLIEQTRVVADSMRVAYPEFMDIHDRRLFYHYLWLQKDLFSSLNLRRLRDAEMRRLHQDFVSMYREDEPTFDANDLIVPRDRAWMRKVTRRGLAYGFAWSLGQRLRAGLR
jgi:glycosyltransferase involved in cell wall biosynthesis